jgi:integrase/recombinase XerD
MGDPSRVRVTGPLAGFAEGFAAELARLGYKPNAAADQLRVMAHLSRWMDAGRIEAAALTPQVAGEFLAARRAAGYVMWLSPKGLAPLLGYLRRLGAVPVPLPVAVTPAGAVLERYRCYLLSERGLAGVTARSYGDLVCSFLERHEEAGGPGLGQLTAGEVTAFVLAVCAGRPGGTARLTVTALRSLLGFMHVEGLIREPLAQYVPSVASWRLSGLPRGLEPGQVAALLASALAINVHRVG